MSAEEYVHTEQVIMANQTCHSLEHDEYIAIRTTTALLSHNGKERRVVIAMDPCSNSTNIDEDFAKDMGLYIEEKGLVRNINFSRIIRNSPFRFGIFHFISAKQRKIIQD